MTYGDDLGRGPRAVRPVVQNPIGRGVLVAAGTLCVVLGLLGVVVPLLPTTPFLLLAAACYMRSSERLHGWLYSNRLFGNYLRHYQAGAGIPLRAKVTMLALLWLTLGSSALALAERMGWARLLLFIPGVGVTFYLLRLKTRRD